MPISEKEIFYVVMTEYGNLGLMLDPNRITKTDFDNAIRQRFEDGANGNLGDSNISQENFVKLRDDFKENELSFVFKRKASQINIPSEGLEKAESSDEVTLAMLKHPDFMLLKNADGSIKPSVSLRFNNTELPRTNFLRDDAKFELLKKRFSPKEIERLEGFLTDPVYWKLRTHALVNQRPCGVLNMLECIKKARSVSSTKAVTLEDLQAIANWRLDENKSGWFWGNSKAGRRESGTREFYQAVRQAKTVKDVMEYIDKWPKQEDCIYSFRRKAL